MAVSNRVRAALTTTVLHDRGDRVHGRAAPSAATRTRSPTAPTRTARSSTTTTATTATAGRARGLFFLYLGGFRSGLPVGTVLPRGGTRINPTDTAARPRAGLPRTGKVSGGHAGQRRHRQRPRRPGRHRRGQLTGPLSETDRERDRPARAGRPRSRRRAWSTTGPHLPGGEVRSYWREGPFYDFSLAEIERLEGCGRPAVRDVRRRRRPRRRQRPVRPDAHPADGPAADPRARWEERAAERLRPVRPALRRRGAAEAAGVQRRHPDRAGRVGRHPVELAPVHRPGRATSGTRCTTSWSPPGSATC